MAFKQILIENLKSKIDEDKLHFLPSGFQRIGDIIVLNLNKEVLKYKKEIGKIVLNNFKVRSVCLKEGGITGTFREPQISVIAGDKCTVVTHFENGCYYNLDIKKIMFAKGNLSERVRIAKQVRHDEIIVDMFAGLGYFSVPIAKLGKPKKIYAIELNPVSFKFLKENLSLNKIEGIVEAINGDSKEEVLKLVENGVKADRVLMGYLPPPKEFLPYAMKIIKKKGFLHYEDLIRTEYVDEDVGKAMKLISDAAAAEGLKVKLLLAKRVKGYAPKIEHYVLDIAVF
ncbi:class I SAM-dependent methyltransferase family protein [Candidatus Pacearchaeota archaeon]|nr:class I SAM-dependent methyltransferase family protein [Candidatus Pacearchaeota archaeon]